MSELLWIQNGRVIDPANNRDEIADVFSRDGLLVSHLEEDEKSRAQCVDATGLIVCPGLVDIHVHFREPGQTHKETIKSGSYAAAAGGFTTVVCMPNTTPPCDNPGTIQLVKDAIKRHAIIDVQTTGCITKGMEGNSLAPIGSLKKAGVVAITDDGLCVQNNEIMRRALEYASMFNLPVLDHCQDYDLTSGAVMNEGEWSLRLGLQGWPNAAEDIIVSRNVILSTYTGARIHLQNITSAYSVDVIRRAKERKVNITAEVSPHHISITEESLKTYNTFYKMNPPLRTEKDRQALIAGIRDGVIDCIASDHAPHTDYEKDVEFAFAPNGIIGLETSLAVSYQALVASGHIQLIDLIDLMTRKPADLLSLDCGSLTPGKKADITLFNPDATWVPVKDGFQSQSTNSPWIDKPLKCRIVSTFHEGRLVWDGEKVHLKPENP